LVELLKNSFNATVEYAEYDDEEVKQRPVHILVSHDAENIAIRVSDRAGGIPLVVGDRIWSYMSGAAAGASTSLNAPSALAGYGVGLPLSRLHARYLGGKLEITSYPGYGTDAYLQLPRITSKMVETLPSDNVDVGS